MLRASTMARRPVFRPASWRRSGTGEPEARGASHLTQAKFDVIELYEAFASRGICYAAPAWHSRPCALVSDKAAIMLGPGVEE
jgi:hypothetical protein